MDGAGLLRNCAGPKDLRLAAADGPLEPGEAAGRLWLRLERACRDRQDGFRTPALATVGLDGGARVRTLVLRAVDAALGLLWLHSDGRSAKISEIAHEPRVALLFLDWDGAAGQGLQLRLEGEAALCPDAERVAAMWERVPADSRRNYAGGDSIGVAPGFAVIEVRARRMAWLWLRGAEQQGGLCQEGPGGWRCAVESD